MKITGYSHNDLAKAFVQFCALNDILFEDDAVPYSKHKFKDHLAISFQRDYSTLEMDDFKQALLLWQRGSTDIRKPRKLSMHFIGKIINTFRSSNQTNNTVNQNRHSDQVEADKPKTGESWEKTVRRNYPIIVAEWQQIRDKQIGMPIRILLEHYDNLFIDAKIYDADTFDPDLILSTYRAWQRVESMQQQSFLKKIENKSRKGARRMEVDRVAIGRVGCYFNTLSNGIEHEPPQEIIDLLHQNPNGY